MDINTQIRNNLGLVYSQLARFRLTNDQDAESFAYEALYKAIQTYDSTSNTAFSTYATCVIANTLRMHLRTKNKKRQIETTSYYTPVNETTCILDVLSSDVTVEDEVCKRETYKELYEAFDEAFEALTSDTQRSVIYAWRDADFNITQSEIANMLGISQAAVSRTISNFKYKLRRTLNERNSNSY